MSSAHVKIANPPDVQGFFYREMQVTPTLTWSFQLSWGDMWHLALGSKKPFCDFYSLE